MSATRMSGPAPYTTTSTKLRRVVISFELLRDLFTTGAHPPRSYSVIKDAIPADAMLVNVQHAWPNCMELLLWSESFEEVKPGDPIPPLDIVCQTIGTGLGDWLLAEIELEDGSGGFLLAEHAAAYHQTLTNLGVKLKPRS